ncbi:MAG: AraC family transcriptional regulator [Edaphobacter sp.]
MQELTGLTSIASGPPEVLHSSASLPWSGFLLERHLTHPGERQLSHTDRHVITLLCSKQSIGEHLTLQGMFAPFSKKAGAITVLPAGPVLPVRIRTAAQHIHCGLDDAFVQRIANEMDRSPSTMPHSQTMHDNVISRLLKLLETEMLTGGETGILYAESLAQALTVRYLSLNENSDQAIARQISPLPQAILRRVKEYMEEHLQNNLSLDELARETNYSRGYFLRMFRAAAGKTPHQYLTERRIERAKSMLQDAEETSLINIAARCGFSSQSHMTRVFREQIGVTPSAFKRMP